jgi:hypothetical protein
VSLHTHTHTHTHTHSKKPHADTHTHTAWMHTQTHTHTHTARMHTQTRTHARMHTQKHTLHECTRRRSHARTHTWGGACVLSQCSVGSLCVRWISVVFDHSNSFTENQETFHSAIYSKQLKTDQNSLSTNRKHLQHTVRGTACRLTRHLALCGYVTGLYCVLLYITHWSLQCSSFHFHHYIITLFFTSSVYIDIVLS